MLNMFIYMYIMVLMFVFFMGFSFMVMYMGMSVVFEWLFYSLNSINLEMMILVDWISSMFVGVIFLITSLIILYSMIYMQMEKNISQYFYLLILFVVSMVFMIISPNIVSIMIGWDGLGLISYCLVIFYSSYSSYNSGMVTVLSNRVGDVGLLMSISLMMMGGSWNMFMNLDSSMVLFMILIAAITKSAQIPFSVWLPMAMAAPTPISALVHSSTLVTAGVYLLIRFNYYLMNSGFSMMLLFLSILTMLVSGVVAMMEVDLKKIIALSTLSQLGLMMMTLSVGLSMLSFYHLLTHAIFKSLLFMCAGAIIHSVGDIQDMRLLGGLNKLIPFIMMSFYISVLSLAGFPFMSGFYSKDLIMEVIYELKLNSIIYFFIIFSISLTVMYSIRLFYSVYMSEMKMFSLMMIKESNKMNLSMFMLMLVSIVGGSILNWMFFFDLDLPCLSFKDKFLTMFMCFMGIVMFLMYLMLDLFKIYFMMFYFSSMWFLSYFYKCNYSIVNKGGGEIYNFDKMWVEYMKKMFLLNIILMFKNYLFMNFYKIYMYMSMMVFLVIYLYFIY